MAKSFNARMRDRFTSITTNGNKLNTYIHETAMMIAGHAKEHGDCSLANEFVLALPASMRREMLILWFATFTPIVTKNDPKWVAKMHKPDTKGFVAFDLEAGNATPFYKLAETNKEREPLDFDGLVALVKRLATTIEKKVEKGEVKDTDIESAKAMARQISGLSFTPVAQPGADKPIAEGPKARAARTAKEKVEANA